MYYLAKIILVFSENIVLIAGVYHKIGEFPATRILYIGLSVSLISYSGSGDALGHIGGLLLQMYIIFTA